MRRVGRVRGVFFWGAMICCTFVGARSFALPVEVFEEIASLPKIKKAWSSSGVDYGTTDSLAACPVDDGKRVFVFATAKKEGRIDVFDATTGVYERSVGRSGSGDGEFKYPNGIATVSFRGTDNLQKTFVLIVDRDNARVVAYDPNTPGTMSFIITDGLYRPYGCTVSCSGSSVFLYVTDTEVPYEQTIKKYELTFVDGKMLSRYLFAFGDGSGSGVIQEAESIVVDEPTGRVFVCDEAARPKNVKVYMENGGFTGKTIGDGLFKGDPEGVIVIQVGNRRMVVVTEQRKYASIWHIYDADSLEYRGAFTGKDGVANTDGICILPCPFNGFPAGAFFVVHDDSEVRAYQLQNLSSLMN